MMPDAGAELQGKMIVDYLKNSAAKIDINSDKQIGYVLCIGNENNNDSMARTIAVRKALGTWDSETEKVKEGSITIGDKIYTVKELAAAEMKAPDGSTWSDKVAEEKMLEWKRDKGTAIDLVIANNDGMALACLDAYGNSTDVPLFFGYDAKTNAITSIKEGKLTGTISQNVDAQAAATLQVLRNLLDGLTGAEVYTAGFSKADKYGNKISVTTDYKSPIKSFWVSNTAVDLDNAEQYVKDTRDPGIKQITGPSKKVLLTIYNNDDFMRDLYIPALEHYARLMNLKLTIIIGNGQTEESCLDKLTNMQAYDAYAFNMLKETAASKYLEKL